MIKIPVPNDYFLNTALYNSFEISIEETNAINRIEAFRGSIDTFCNECDNNSIFKHSETFIYENSKINPKPKPGISIMGASPGPKGSFDTLKKHLDQNNPQKKADLRARFEKGKILIHEFKCSRNELHKIIFISQITDCKICKIGQYPSIADIKQNDLIKYKNVLGRERFKELQRALGLHAHGIGVGAFVYLRRIFETLIEDAHLEAQKNENWNEEKFLQSKYIAEKIECLRDFLPDFLLENKNIYSILSHGIHELSEEECKKYFPIIMNGIQLILDAILSQKEKEKKIHETKKAIDDIGRQIRKSK